MHWINRYFKREDYIKDYFLAGVPLEDMRELLKKETGIVISERILFLLLTWIMNEIIFDYGEAWNEEKRFMVYPGHPVRIEEVKGR